MRVKSIAHVVVLELLAFWGGVLLFGFFFAALVLRGGEVWARQQVDFTAVFGLQIGLAVGIGAWVGGRKGCPDSRSFFYGSLIFFMPYALALFSARNLVYIAIVPISLSITAIRQRKRISKASA